MASLNYKIKFKDFRDRLRATSLGNNVFWNVRPQSNKTFPSCAINIVDRIPHNTFSGASKLDFTHIDLHLYHTTKEGVEDLFLETREKLEDRSINDSIDECWFKDSGADDYLDDLGLYTLQAEYKITIQ